jgi:tRNA(Ile)-lysidine synthase
MDLLVKSLKDFFDQHDISDHQPVAVAVSGGGDSMALCFALAQLCRDLHVLIVNHDLRPESKDECQLVYDFCHTLRNTYPVILKWDWRASGGGVTTAILEKARAARYDLLMDYCQSHHIRNLFVAHHGDDQMETILFRLIRGSGIEGLIGMKERTLLCDHLFINRPFLKHSKQDLLDFCKAHQIAYVNDPSNHNPLYTRPRLRQIMPLLREEGISIPRINRLSKRALWMQELVDFTMQSAFENQDLFISKEPSLIQINDEQFQKYPTEIRVRLLEWAILCIKKSQAQNNDENKASYPLRRKRIEAALVALDQQGDVKNKNIEGINLYRKGGIICLLP